MSKLLFLNGIYYRNGMANSLLSSLLVAVGLGIGGGAFRWGLLDLILRLF